MASKMTTRSKSLVSSSKSSATQSVAAKKRRAPSATSVAPSDNKDVHSPATENKNVGSGARRPPKFSFVVDGLLAGQGRPTLPGHIKFLLDNHFEYIVTLTLNKPRALIDLPGELQWVHIPIQDETAPTLDQIKQFVALVDKAKDENKRVAVHCAWGRGRTGTMLACYLAKHRHFSASEAIAEIRRLRPGSVDTDKQIKAVESFVDSLNESQQ